MTTTTTTPATLSINVNVNVSEVFVATLGGRISYWANELSLTPDLSNADIYDNNQVADITISYYENDYDENSLTTKTITPEQLCKAYLDLLLAGYTHCGNYPITASEYDSCVGDLIIQHALFGEIKFG